MRSRHQILLLLLIGALLIADYASPVVASQQSSLAVSPLALENAPVAQQASPPTQEAARQPDLAPSAVIAIPLDPPEQLICTIMSEDEIYCSDNSTYIIEARDEPFSVEFYIHIGIVGGLVLFAGLMSGLTMGLMSMDTLNLEVLMKSGTAKQKAYAARILPLVKRHHLLLVTLLLANAAAMETLPIFLNKVVPEWIAIIVSVTLVLFFGEVIPQAVCTRYGLAIGANLFWLVWFLIAVTFVVSWPISKLLDLIIGAEHSHLFRRNELKALVSLHQLKGNVQHGGTDGAAADASSSSSSTHPDDGKRTVDYTEGLTEDEVKIIRGALELKEKKVGDALCPLDDVFMLEFNSVLDKKTIHIILKEGHSRVPIYRRNRQHIIGVLLMKTILRKAAGSTEPVSISKLELRAIPTVTTDKPLFEMLHLFRSGRSHMAIVLNASDNVTCAGIITLEDVVEELIQMEIWDEDDVEKNRQQQTPVKKPIDINKYYNERTPLIEQYGFSV